MKLVNVYGRFGLVRNGDAQLLYELLGERRAEQNISHKEMPTWEQHLAFIAGRPYLAWYLIYEEEHCLGAIYLSKQREIGVFLFNGSEHQGYGREAVSQIMALHPGKFLANVAPMDIASQRFFERIGFDMVQVTYSLK